MSETVIHVGGDDLASMLEGHWLQGGYDGDGAMCLHGAIRRCCPVPGDACLIEWVEARLGRWSTGWNDDDDRTEAEVVALARQGWDITDADLAVTFGPQWRAVVALVRRAAALTPDEVRRVAAAWNAARGAAMDAAWAAARGAAWAAARGAAWGAARAAAWDAARAAAMDAARNAAMDAARNAAMDAAWAVAMWDLATDDGPYTPAMRDLLLAPWVEVCGLPEGLVGREDEGETKWKPCDDPEVLAAAVAAGVKVRGGYGPAWPSSMVRARDFTECIEAGTRYWLPADWKPTPEPPADDEPCATNPCEACRYRIPAVWSPAADALRDTDPGLIRHLRDMADRWGARGVMMTGAALWPDALPAPPVPPWPGAVPSGLTDEDGVPTWLAQAGQVRGEQVRRRSDLMWADNNELVAFSDTVWVEVRDPRPVPVPETERVPWWEALGRLGLAGDPFVEVGSGDEGPWVRVVEGGTKLYSPVAPDGTVEVLKDGES